MKMRQLRGATFLMVELNGPFDGLLEISSDGAHTVMAALAGSLQ